MLNTLMKVKKSIITLKTYKYLLDLNAYFAIFN